MEVNITVGDLLVVWLLFLAWYGNALYVGLTSGRVLFPRDGDGPWIYVTAGLNWFVLMVVVVLAWAWLSSGGAGRVIVTLTL